MGTNAVPHQLPDLHRPHADLLWSDHVQLRRVAHEDGFSGLDAEGGQGATEDTGRRLALARLVGERGDVEKRQQAVAGQDRP